MWTFNSSTWDDSQLFLGMGASARSECAVRHGNKAPCICLNHEHNHRKNTTSAVQKRTLILLRRARKLGGRLARLLCVRRRRLLLCCRGAGELADLALCDVPEAVPRCSLVPLLTQLHRRSTCLSDAPGLVR